MRPIHVGKTALAVWVVGALAAPASVVACAGRALDIGGGADNATNQGDTPTTTSAGTASDGGLSVGPPIAAAAFCAQHAARVCAALQSCCKARPEPEATLDEPTCLREVASRCDVELRSTADAGATYAPELGGSCLATMTEANVCTGVSQGAGRRISKLCPGLFKGSLTEGTICNPTYPPCATGLVCAEQTQKPPPPCAGPNPCDFAPEYACTRPPALGQACTSICAEGLGCKVTGASSTCQPIVDVDEGARCQAARCEPGWRCGTERCKAGLFCDVGSGTCKQRHALGAKCGDPSQCASEVCVPATSTCVPANRKTVEFCWTDAR